MKRFAVFALCAGLIALAGCKIGLDEVLDSRSTDAGGNSLEVVLVENVSRSLLPGLSMNVSSYSITGAGPAPEHSFSVTANSGSSVVVSDLFPGSWTVQVDALNSSGAVIGSGTGTAVVSTAKSSSVNITVKPLDGTGTLSLSLSWTVADVQTPSVQAVLAPVSGGDDIDLAFTLADGTASCSAASLAAGYYTLKLNLLDTGAVVAGATEIVRIVKDQTTSGAFTFDKIANIDGYLSLVVATDLDNPLTVTISGAQSQKPENLSLNLAASATGAAGVISWTWTVNGLESGTGNSFTMGTGYAPGTYRIDAIAVDAAGGSAGSAKIEVAVTAVAMPTDGLEYTLLADGSGYEVAKGTAIVDGLVVVPASYEGLPVTALAPNAFAGTAMTGIVLPETLTAVGNQAFFRCTNLVSISLPDSVLSLGTGAFSGCTKLASLSIPPLVTTVSDNLFYMCHALKSVTIPEGVTIIGSYAFYYCNGLTSVTIPEGVTSIGSHAFYNCNGLTSVAIPEGVTSIGSSAFSYCSGLTSVAIPEGVTNIGYMAFYNCSKLVSVTFTGVPKGIDTGTSGSFSGDPLLSTICIEGDVVASESAFLGSVPALRWIKVRAELVEAYKASTVWAAYADKIVAL